MRRITQLFQWIAGRRRLRNGVRAANGMMALLALITVMSVGCRTAPRAESGGSGGSPAASMASASKVEHIRLMAAPMAVHLDDRPGSDGLGVNLYLFERGSAKSQPFNSGTVRFEYWEQSTTDADGRIRKPDLVWTRTPAQLKRYERQTSIGSCYSLALGWGSRTPKAKQVHLRAVFVAPDGVRRASPTSMISVPN